MANDLDVQSNCDTSEPAGERVGYGHPPKHSQFRPGQSGNVRGRPKGRRTFKMDIIAALDAVSGGADGKKTNQRKLAENLVSDAVARDALAIKIIAPIALSLDENGGDGEDDDTALQQKLVEDFNRREEPTESEDGGDHDPEL
jgi:hypothetical protein